MEKYSNELAKKRGSRIDPAKLTPESHQAIFHIKDAIHKVFKRQQDRAQLEVDRLVKTMSDTLKKREYHSVQFNLSPEDAKNVLEVPILDTDFTLKGREKEPHVTVLFGLQKEITPEDVNKITKNTGEIEATLLGYDTFPEGPDGIPLIIPVDSDALHALHRNLAELDHISTHKEYRPHITVGYLKPGTEAQYLKLVNPLEGDRIILKNLVFSHLDKSQTELEKYSKGTSEEKLAMPELPPNHHAAMRVPKGGSCCANCEYLGDDKKSCRNDYFIKWDGGKEKPADSDRLPYPADEYCSDWYEPENELLEAAYRIGAAPLQKAISGEGSRKTIFMMRHGKTALDPIKRSDGWLDFPLSDDGRVKLLTAEQYLKETPITKIYCSDLKRHRETAEIIQSGSIYNPQIVIDNRAKTWNLGILAGQQKYANKKKVRLLMDNPNQVPEGGESRNSFRKRFLSLIGEIQQKAKAGRGPFLIVLSGSNLRELSDHIYNDVDVLDLDEGGMLSMQPSGDKWNAQVLFGHKSLEDEKLS